MKNACDLLNAAIIVMLQENEIELDTVRVLWFTEPSEATHWMYMIAQNTHVLDFDIIVHSADDDVIVPVLRS